MLLGACQTIGRTQPDQHRAFVGLLRRDWRQVYAVSATTAEQWIGHLDRRLDDAILHQKYDWWFRLYAILYQLNRHLDAYVRVFNTAGRRKEFTLTKLLAPRVDSQLSGAGPRWDAPPLVDALGKIGAHWILRELVRLGVVSGGHIHRVCFVPSESVRRMAETLGCELHGAEGEEASAGIHRWLSAQVGLKDYTFGACFDLPLREIDRRTDLKQEFGIA